MFRAELGCTPAGPRIPARATLLSSKPERSLRRIKPATSGLFPWPDAFPGLGWVELAGKTVHAHGSRGPPTQEH